MCIVNHIEASNEIQFISVQARDQTIKMESRNNFN